MILKKIEISNIFSFDKFIFNFEENDHIFLYGINGVGKSSLLECITWCLFDKTSKGYSKDRVIRNHVGSGYVSLTFIFNNKKVKVKRTRGTKNKLHLMVDGEVVFDGRSKVADVESMLYDIIQIDFDTFISIAYSGQEASSFFEGAQKERIRKLCSIFKFNEIDGVYDFVDKKLSEVGSKFYEYKAKADAEREILNRYGVNPVKKTNEEIEEAKDDYNKVLSDIKLLKSKIVEIKKMYKYSGDLKSELKKLKLSFWTAKNEIKRIKEEIPTRKTRRMKVISNELTRICKLYGELHNKLREVCDKVIIYRNDVEDRKRVVEEKLNICYVCLRKIDKDTKIVMSLELKERENKLIEFENRKVKITEKVGKNQNDIKLLENELEDAKAIRDDERYLSGLKKGKNVIADKIGVIRMKISKNKGVDVDKKLNDLINKLGGLLGKRSELEFSIKNMQIRLKQIKDCRKRHKRACEKMEKYSDRVDFYEFWKEAFHYKGIQSILVGQLLEQISLLTNEFLTNIDCYMRVTIKEDGSVLVKDLVTDCEKDMEEYSGGERKRLNIALFLSLNKLSYIYSKTKINFVMFDELFDGINNESMDMILEAVGSFFVGRKQFIVASHTEVSSGFINRNVQLVRNENGVTRIADG